MITVQRAVEIKHAFADLIESFASEATREDREQAYRLAIFGHFCRVFAYKAETLKYGYLSAEEQKELMRINNEADRLWDAERRMGVRGVMK
jgi:hypothetical protein